jgi:outer membrane protein assembly factor BamB
MRPRSTPPLFCSLSPLRLFATSLLLLVLAASTARAVDTVTVPVTAKELSQGFRDRTLLAKPRASHRTTADADESRERVRVRARFAHLHDLRVIELADDDLETVTAAIARLAATGRYEFVEPDRIRQLAATPNDTSFANQWPLNNTGQSGGIPGADIKATAAWDIIREAPGVVVAVVDSGLNLTHQDLAPNLWVNPLLTTANDRHGANFVGGRGNLVNGNPTDESGHGTHVAGIIGAVGNNALGTAGIAWQVQLMAIKVFPATGGASVSDIAAGINYAISRGAHIINASYGDTGGIGFSQTELSAVTSAREAGVIFVAAAGNDGANMDVARHYPASFPLDNIVTVGSTTRSETVATSSNFGTAVDLLAPGDSILSLGYTNNTGTATLSGTSMAAPHVTGALALLKARFPADSYRQLINRLLRGTDVIPRYAGKSQTGSRLNLLGALSTTSNRPFNDDFASRARLAGNNFLVRSNNAGATAESGEPASTAGPAATSLWWEWTPATTAAVRLTTTGSAYDTVLTVYTGTGLTGLTPTAANDNDGAAVTSRIDFTAQAGVTYQISVDGKAGASGLTLLNLGTVPANDAFAAPVTLTGLSDGVTATNANCTREPGEPRILTFAGGTSLWYRWIAPRSGRFHFAATSEDFDPILAVYTGATLTSLTLVTSNDNSGPANSQTASLCSMDAVAGTTYLIAVDSKTASAIGTFTLTVSDALWQANTGSLAVAGSNLTGAPAVGPDGSIYIGSTDRSLYAFSPEGTLKWTHLTGGLIDTCSPAVADDGTIYVGSNDGLLYALRPEGTVQWSRNFSSAGVTVSAGTSPSIAADGTVYLKVSDGFLYALSPTDGATKWRRNVNAIQTYASASIAPDGTIYQGSEDKKLYALNPADGSVKWSYTTDNDIYTAPALDAAGNLYFGVVNSGRLYSLTPAGTLRWTYPGAMIATSSSPALSADGATVYFAAYDKKLHAVATATGAARWTYLLGDEVRASSPAVDSNGLIYIGCYDYKLYAINPDGSLNRTWSTGNWIRSCPAISGNTLYVGSNDHKLYAISLGTAGPANSPWPQFRHNPRRLGRAVNEALAITAAPVSQTALVNSTVTLTVAATGQSPLAYQWFKDSLALAGATAASYTVANVSAASAGRYTVTVSGPQGSVTSAPAVVTVEQPISGRLVNLSVRTSAGTGAQTLTVGFVVGAGPAKPLLVRGIGPGLTPFGVASVLTDPQVQLFTPSTAAPLATNDNWGGSSALATSFASVGAFALTPASLDAALLRSLPSGSYSVQISGATAETGIALAELYDTDPTPTGAQTLVAVSRLLNVSARAQVGTASGILIAGFTLSGNLPKTVLVRAIGPGLSQFGLTDILADPRLELYRDTAQLNANDNWGATTGGTAALANAFLAVGAFALPSSASRDAVLLVTLPPGSYTAQVSGVNNTTGVALVEVYEVP